MFPLLGGKFSFVYAAGDGVTAPDLLCPLDTPPIIDDQFASTIAFQDSASCRAVEKCVERLKKSGREAEAEQLLSQHQMTFEELNECFELSQLPGRSRTHSGGSPYDLKQQSMAVSNYCRQEHWRSEEFLFFEAEK